MAMNRSTYANVDAQCIRTSFLDTCIVQKHSLIAEAKIVDGCHAHGWESACAETAVEPKVRSIDPTSLGLWRAAASDLSRNYPRRAV